MHPNAAALAQMILEHDGVAVLAAFVELLDAIAAPFAFGAGDSAEMKQSWDFNDWYLAYSEYYAGGCTQGANPLGDFLAAILTRVRAAGTPDGALLNTLLWGDCNRSPAACRMVAVEIELMRRAFAAILKCLEDPPRTEHWGTSILARLGGGTPELPRTSPAAQFFIACVDCVLLAEDAMLPRARP